MKVTIRVLLKKSKKEETRVFHLNCFHYVKIKKKIVLLSLSNVWHIAFVDATLYYNIVYVFERKPILYIILYMQYKWLLHVYAYTYTLLRFTTPSIRVAYKIMIYFIVIGEMSPAKLIVLIIRCSMARKPHEGHTFIRF